VKLVRENVSNSSSFIYVRQCFQDDNQLSAWQKFAAELSFIIDKFACETVWSKTAS
jgi:hypothetical protein